MSSAKLIDRQEQLDATLAEYDGVVDGLGLGLDPGIKRTVVLMNLLGMSTSGSCEGHPDQEHGLDYPWIDISAPEPEGWMESTEKQTQWFTENLQLHRQLLEMLGNFYSGRSADSLVRLYPDPMGIYGAVRLCPSHIILPTHEGKTAVERHALMANEVADFTDFLERYFLETK